MSYCDFFAIIGKSSIVFGLSTMRANDQFSRDFATINTHLRARTNPIHHQHDPQSIYNQPSIIILSIYKIFPFSFTMSTIPSTKSPLFANNLTKEHDLIRQLRQYPYAHDLHCLQMIVRNKQKRT